MEKNNDLGSCCYKIAKKICSEDIARNNKKLDKKDEKDYITRTEGKIQHYLERYFMYDKFEKNDIYKVGIEDILPYIDIPFLWNKDSENFTKIMEKILDYGKGLFNDLLKNDFNDVPVLFKKIIEPTEEIEEEGKDISVNSEENKQESKKDLVNLEEKYYSEYRALTRKFDKIICGMITEDSVFWHETNLRKKLNYNGLLCDEEDFYTYAQGRIVCTLRNLKKEIMDKISSKELMDDFGLLGKQYMCLIYIRVCFDILHRILFAYVYENDGCKNKVEVFNKLRTRVSEIFADVKENYKPIRRDDVWMVFSEYILYCKFRKKLQVKNEVLQIINKAEGNIGDTKEEYRVEIDEKEFFENSDLKKNDKDPKLRKKTKGKLQEEKRSKKNETYKANLHNASIVAFFYYRLHFNKYCDYVRMVINDEFEYKAFYTTICKLNLTISSNYDGSSRTTHQPKYICNTIVERIIEAHKIFCGKLKELLKYEGLNSRDAADIKKNLCACEEFIKKMENKDEIFHPSDNNGVYFVSAGIEKKDDKINDVVTYESVQKVLLRKSSYENMPEEIKSIVWDLLNPKTLYIFQNEKEQYFFGKCLDLSKYREIGKVEAFFAENKFRLQLNKLICLVMSQLDTDKIIENITGIFEKIYNGIMDCLIDEAFWQA